VALTLPSFAQSGPSGTKILVLPFKINTSGDQKGLAASLPELLAEALRSEGMTASLEKPSGPVDDQTARRLAASAKASHALYGSVSQIGQDISIDGRLVPVSETGQPLSVFAQAKDLMHLQPAARELAGKARGLLVSGDAIVAGDVEGNQILDKDVIILKAKTQVGQPYDPKAVNDDLKRLYETGYFDDVQIRLENVAGGKKLVFVVKEKPRIQAVGVVGSSEIDQDKILETMSIKAGSVLNLKVLADDLEKIRELYRKEGFYKTEVSYELEQTDPRVARLNIVIKEPKKLYIHEVKIEGVSQVDADELRDELSTSERRFWSWVTGSGVLKEEMLERDAAAIENFYANRGYVDIKVGQPDVEYGDQGITVVFRVDEGDRYKVGKVAFTGDLLMEDDALMAIIKLDQKAEENAYFDRSVVRDDLNVLTEMYADFGFAFAQADVDLNKNDADKTIDVTYVINKGRRVFVRRVLIEGNEKTRDNVIRREMRLADGDLFNGTRLRRSNERLDRLDYFEKIDIETVPTENPTEVDIRSRSRTRHAPSAWARATRPTTACSSAGPSRSATSSAKATTPSSRACSAAPPAVRPDAHESPVQRHQPDHHLSLYDMYKSYDDYDKETIGGKLTFGYPSANSPCCPGLPSGPLPRLQHQLGRSASSPSPPEPTGAVPSPSRWTGHHRQRNKTHQGHQEHHLPGIRRRHRRRRRRPDPAVVTSNFFYPCPSTGSSTGAAARACSSTTAERSRSSNASTWAASKTCALRAEQDIPARPPHRRAHRRPGHVLHQLRGHLPHQQVERRLRPALLRRGRFLAGVHGRELRSLQERRRRIALVFSHGADPGGIRLRPGCGPPEPVAASDRLQHGTDF
jgi:outer membrane protein insertion porin family